MTIIKNSFIHTIFVVIISLYQTEVYSAGIENLNINAQQGLLSGYMNDGTLVGQVTVNVDDNVTGLHLWSDNIQSPTSGNSYALQGKNRPENIVVVRLDVDGAMIDDLTKNGLVLDPTNHLIRANVVIDGDQEVKADTYRLSIKSQGRVEN